jgi:thiosulfate/3-mercaptopyruvate sulfurtransferase
MLSDNQIYGPVYGHEKLLRRMQIFGLVLAALVILQASSWALDLRLADPSQAAGLRDAIILDARPEKEWRKGHIPGALSFSWEDYTRTGAEGEKWRIFPPEELADALGGLGISHTDAILVYGDADTSWGGEGWLVWVLAWLGHEGPVYFLDGGIQSWQADERPLSSITVNPPAPAKYQVRLRPELNITTEQIQARQGEIHLIDTRNYLTEWLPGRLPGAVHISWKKFYQGRQRQVLSPEELKTLLISEGLDLDKPVVYYCTAGIRSGYTWLVHQLSALPAAVNHEGGTEEWMQKHPLVK